MNELQIKAAVRARDGQRCVKCGRTREDYYAQHRRKLEVHRLIPGSAYTVDGCITCCKRCHKQHHRKPRRGKPLIVDTKDAIWRAVQLRKVKMPQGTTLSDIVNGILRGTLDPLTLELAELKQPRWGDILGPPSDSAPDGA